MAGRFSSADVGRLVSVRHVTPSGQSDTVGHLLAWDAGTLTIARRDGSVLQVPPQTLLAGRRVPDPARETPDLELERIASLGWRGLEEDPVDGWLLRAGGGFTGRANSALPLGEPDPPLADVVAWYAARGLPAKVQVPVPARADLDARLDALGWAPANAAAVMTADLVAVRARTADRPELPPVTISPAPDEPWLAAYHYRGSTLPAAAVDVLCNAPVVGFASVVEDGRVVAIGRGAVGERWLGITAMEVDAGARRRGLAQHVLRALCSWGGRHGARHAYLQVAEGNAAAVALYERTGFAVHHRYVYRQQP